jgi:hypothetical protein
MGRITSGSNPWPASSMKIWVKCPRLMPRCAATPPERHVDTTTRYLRRSSTAGRTNVKLSFTAEKGTRSFPRSIYLRERALSLKSCSFPSDSRFRAIRSAAELLGAQARMRASGSRRSSWFIASTIVTVLPVPGLKSGQFGFGKVRNNLRPKDYEWSASRWLLNNCDDRFELLGGLCNSPVHGRNTVVLNHRNP